MKYFIFVLCLLFSIPARAADPFCAPVNTMITANLTNGFVPVIEYEQDKKFHAIFQNGSAYLIYELEANGDLCLVGQGRYLFIYPTKKI